MNDEFDTVVEGIQKTFNDFKEKNDQRLEQIEKNGKADPLLEEQITKMSTRMDELDAAKDELEKAQTALARKSSHADTGEGSKLEQKASEFAHLVAKQRGIQVDDKFGANELAAYRKHFFGMLRKGDSYANQPESMKALSVGSDPDGGYTVDPDTNGRIIEKIFESSPMRSVASVQTIGTDALEGLYDLNEASAGWVNETGSRPSTNTPQLGQWRIPVHELYADAPATQKILDDSMVNLEQWLSMKVADKFTRIENAAFVNGSGVGQPRGFLTYPDGTTLPGTIEQKDSGVNGGFATDGTGGDVLLDVIYAMKQSYRSGARWVMPRGVTAEVRKIKDGQGNYIWAPGIAAGQPASLLGYNVVEFEDMPDLATGSLSMAFANFGEGYQIVDRQGIRVLRDPYTNKPYVHFYTVKRTGGDVLNFEAIKIVNFSA